MPCIKQTSLGLQKANTKVSLNLIVYPELAPSPFINKLAIIPSLKDLPTNVLFYNAAVSITHSFILSFVRYTSCIDIKETPIQKKTSAFSSLNESS